jgi:glycosyltransferase involved in cell wall biosynthesis
MNAADPRIFHRRGRIPFDRQRRVRLMSTSWSDNPNKGAAIYKWIEDHLDWDRFDYTFVGRSTVRFERIRVLAPVPSAHLSTLLRQHDIYIAASRNDPCSNSLIEALSCGLPAVYLKSGGHPEIVGEGGLGFVHEQEIPELLDRLVDDYESRQQRISVPSLAEVTDRYLEAMGVASVEVA